MVTHWSYIFLALTHRYDCTNASEVILKDMDKIDQYQTSTKLNKV